MKIKIIHDDNTTEYELTLPGPVTEKASGAPILVSDAITAAGISWSQPCGGRGVCGKCRVEIDGEYKLACQTVLSADAVITLPDSRSERILTAGLMPDFAREPWGIHSNSDSIGDIRGIGNTEFGLAVDIGTTTVAAYLFDLVSGECMAEKSALNPQRAFGADVISRMERSIAGEGEALRRLITDCISDLIGELCAAAEISSAEISSAVITGNTAMQFFLCGEDVKSLAGLPFIPDRYFGEFISPEVLGIRLSPDAEIYLPRCIAAYVGADITSGIIATEIYKASRPVLLVDIGTNGEMALQTGVGLLCCSTAAGSAFEGNRPGGLSGSALVDAIAEGLSSGAIEPSGRINEKLASELGVFSVYNGETALKITCDERAPDSSSIFLTQGDIRAVQLAKAAICAGMRTLLHHAGLSPYDVETLYIAGGFGTYMNAENAAAIGLIIPELAAKAKSVGNSAGVGAAMLLQSRSLLIISEDAAKQAKTLELGTDKFFMESYIDCMTFEPE